MQPVQPVQPESPVSFVLPPTIDPVPLPPEQSTAPIDNIFADQKTSKSLDVTSIITKRLNAMRKLQDNPLDSEAIKLMYRTQKDVRNNFKLKSSSIKNKHQLFFFSRCPPGQIQNLYLVNSLAALVLAFYRQKSLPLAFKHGLKELVHLFYSFAFFVKFKWLYDTNETICMQCDLLRKHLILTFYFC